MTIFLENFNESPKFWGGARPPRPPPGFTALERGGTHNFMQLSYLFHATGVYSYTGLPVYLPLSCACVIIPLLSLIRAPLVLVSVSHWTWFLRLCDFTDRPPGSLWLCAHLVLVSVILCPPWCLNIVLLYNMTSLPRPGAVRFAPFEVFTPPIIRGILESNFAWNYFDLLRPKVIGWN